MFGVQTDSIVKMLNVLRHKTAGLVRFFLKLWITIQEKVHQYLRRLQIMNVPANQA